MSIGKAGPICAVLLWATLAATIAVATETTIGPPPARPRPVQIGLTDVVGEELSAEPKYDGSPLYGLLRLGDGEDAELSVVVDLGPDWAGFNQAYADERGAVELETCPARIYVDANNDEELTNDGAGVLSRCTAVRGAEGSYAIYADAQCMVPYADGTAQPYPVTLYMYPQRGKVQTREGEVDLARTLFCQPNGCFETELSTGAGGVRARFYDQNCDALIMADDGDSLALDLNADGEFDANPKGPELYALDEPFHFGGETYVLNTYGPRGGNATLAVSDEKLPEPTYIAAGEVAPDFSMATLDGGTFTLSEQQGNVVLLDFWATWCGPCRAELPNVVKMWSDLKDDGLVLVGVSLDRDTDAASAVETVTEFAAENSMTWTHIVEGKFWDSEVGDLYQVWGIPQTVLVGRDGKIIAVGLRGEKLQQAAREALAE